MELAGVLQKTPSPRVSPSRARLQGLCLLPQLARTQRGWRARARALPSYCAWELTPSDTAPLHGARLGKPHQVGSHRGALSPAKLSRAAPGRRKLYWWMELSSLFFTELNSTLGHLSWSIKKVSTYGAITPTLCQLCLIHRTTSPAHHTAPLGTDEPTWFCLQCCNFSSRRLLFAWQTTLFLSSQYE